VEDRELAEKVASGDPAAIAKFVDRFYPPIYRFLWHATGSREDAEDLASQALLRARADVRKFRSDGPLAAWIYRVARREFLRFRRRQALTALFKNTHPPDPSTKPPQRRPHRHSASFSPIAPRPTHRVPTGRGRGPKHEGSIRSARHSRRLCQITLLLRQEAPKRDPWPRISGDFELCSTHPRLTPLLRRTNGSSPLCGTPRLPHPPPT